MPPNDEWLPNQLQRLLLWLRNDFAPRHGRARRAAAQTSTAELLQWAQRYLPNHFSRPPSAMHRWLSRQLDRVASQRGSRLNILAPRGAAKSTVAALAYPLREALEGREPILSE